MKLTSFVYAYLGSGIKYRGVDLYLLVHNFIDPASASRQYLRMLTKDSELAKAKPLSAIVKMGRRRVFSQCISSMATSDLITVARDTAKSTVFNSTMWMNDEQIASLYKNPQRRGQTIACIDRLLGLGKIGITAKVNATHAAEIACEASKHFVSTDDDSGKQID